MMAASDIGATAAAAELPEPGSSAAFAVEVFYDGECPLCLREVRWLGRLDVRRRIRFTDIAAAGFEPSALGLDLPRLMARIHARLPSGEWVEGVEVFRRLYAAVGYERLVRASRWPFVSGLLERSYRWFAQNRLRLTGRCETQACAVKPPDRRGKRPA